MNVILLGAPGAGKGSQAIKLVSKLNIPHISTGDIFRANIKNKTEIGLLAKSYIDKGCLVPDDVTIQIVKNRLQEEDTKKGFLLDGFPRTIYQAEQLEKFSKIDKVININVDLNKLVDRITGRRVCGKCNASYHVSTLNGKTVCDICGGTLMQREDDNEKTVKSRISVYTEQTAPLIEFYKKAGVLIDVNGDNTIDEVFKEILNKLG